MPALHRAVALEQVHAVAVRVGEHLDLDVARRDQVFLEQHAVVAEARFRFALRRRERRRERLARCSTTRMPLPPPPAEALISTG